MSFLQNVENVNVIVDETLVDIDSIEEQDHDPELQELLVAEWNLSPAIYAILIQHGFSVEYLKVMDDKSLDDVFSVVKWTGHKYALRQKLVLWPDSALFQSASTSNVRQTSASSLQHPATAECKSILLKHRLLPTSVTSELFNDILCRNEKGKIVVKYFEKHQCLDTASRKHLAHTIVDYYIASDMYFPLPDMAKFAQLIAERFSMELAETYYNPRDAKADKKHPSGLIYDRFHNRNKKKLVQAKSTPGTETIYSKEKTAALNLPEDYISKLTTLKNWLRNNFAPTEIDSDFDHLYGKSDELFDHWEEFSQNFLNYIRSSEIKDDRSRKLLDIHSKPDICQSGRDLILSFVFQALIKQTRRSSGKLPTILEAQLDVCYLCDSYDEYIDHLQSTRRDCQTAKVQVAPRIYAIGSFEDVEAFYVATGKFEYKLPSFLRCLDVVIKLTHVLEYRFAESCEIFWCFLTRYFYGIDYKRKSKNGQLLQLTSYLESCRTEAQ
ncbi:hypothetical protein RP20_CCG018301 [Aedes albopictus]|nr:hypothetical protein RP20_CCG018301 [Aedes albopictus]